MATENYKDKKQSSKTTGKKDPSAQDASTLSQYEMEAEKFEPSQTGAGTLLRARRNIEHVLNLQSLSPEDFSEGDTGLVLYELIHNETDERALIMLKDETRVMHISNEFDKDYEVVVQGSTEMQWEKAAEEEEE